MPAARAPRPSAQAAPRATERPPPYREFRSATGAAILVGRGADRNDELTFKVARGNDLWLHTRDVPGAHVDRAARRAAPIDGETLLDAATLAAHHSNARGEAQVDVVYVARKLVRKPPKSAPGTVTHAGGKTIRVRLEPERLARLLAVARRRGPVATRPARAAAVARCARSTRILRKRLADAGERTRRAAPRANIRLQPSVAVDR